MIVRSWFGAGLLASLSALPVHAQEGYSVDTWLEDLHAMRWETGLLVTGITVVGQRSWDWGSRNSFRFSSEGWFGTGTGSGGADKLGHAFSSYALTNVLLDGLERRGRATDRAAWSAAITAQLIMTYVEIFDAFSRDHGFSGEDVAMNLLGSGLAYARAVHPGLREKLDYRLEYVPSGHGFKPLSDYAGQKYLLALKFSGFDALARTPLRYLELQAGYHSRGFSAAQRDAGMQPSRHRFIGVGLNLNELLWGQRAPREPAARNAARLFLEHVQLPSTAARHASPIGR